MRAGDGKIGEGRRAARAMVVAIPVAGRPVHPRGLRVGRQRPVAKDDRLARSNRRSQPFEVAGGSYLPRGVVQHAVALLLERRPERAEHVLAAIGGPARAE